MSKARIALLSGAVVVGAVIAIMQIGLIFSSGSAALGGRDLQTNLSAAAEYLAAGDYEAGRAAHEAATSSSEQVYEAGHMWQMDVIRDIPGFGVAAMNLQNLGSASLAIADATGELLSLYGDLSGKSGGSKIFRNGAVDLEQLEEIGPRVSLVKSDLEAAEDRLLAIRASTTPARILDRLRGRALVEMDPALRAVNALDSIAPILPEALGSRGAKRYLIAIGNQAEMRASGGAPLTLLMVEFDRGRISIPIKGQTSTQLFPPINAEVEWFGPALNPFFPGNPREDPFVVTNTHPNYLFSAREMSAAWAGQWEGGKYPEVDGVVTMDLTAIAAVLRATGPVESSAYGSVDADRIGQILLVDAYQEFGQAEADDRQAANQELLDGLLTRLLGGDDLVSAAQAVAGTAPGRHFQVWMKDPKIQTLAIESGAAGVVESPASGDWSAIYTQNGNQSKVDVFQQRNVLVSVNLGEDGSARVNQQVTVTNATPADRPEGPLERIGYETSWLRAAYIMYAPDSAKNYRVSYPDGFVVRPFKGHSRQQLGGGWANDGLGNTFIRVVGWTPPGAQNSVSISYDLPAGTFLTDSEDELRYVIRADPQSLFVDSVLTVQVTPPAGWRPIRETGMKISDGTATLSAIQSAPVDAAVRFTR